MHRRQSDCVNRNGKKFFLQSVSIPLFLILPNINLNLRLKIIKISFPYQF